MYVRDLMTPRVITLAPSDTLATARVKLREHRIHHLIVIENSRVVGLLSYRDLIGKDDARTVGEAMSDDVVTVQPWDTARVAASKMLGRTHGCLPVMERGEVTGIITSTDLMRGVSLAKSA